MTVPPHSKPRASWVASRPPTRGGDPAPLGRVLADTQKVASSKTGAALTPDEWRRLVGAKIAARTRVGRLSKNALTVYVASSAWCNELSLLSPDIVARLQRAGLDIHKLELRVSSFDEPTAPSRPSRAPARAAATTRGASEPPAPAPSRQAKKSILPASLQERLALIDDPELRAAIAEAAALSLASQR